MEESLFGCYGATRGTQFSSMCVVLHLALEAGHMDVVWCTNSNYVLIRFSAVCWAMYVLFV